jgi:tetratricopeptide (TPR) repeat protein
MKRIAFFLIFLLLTISSAGQAVSPEVIRSLEERLQRWDVEEAWKDTESLLIREGRDPQLLEVAAQIAFYRGDYEGAKKLIQSALEFGGGEEKRKAFSLFLDETIGVVSSLKKHETPHFLIFVEEKQDGILVDYIRDMLERTHQIMSERYGFQAREKIRVEVFPDTKAFYLASTLSARDIEVAGAVGLAEFNKLMVLSPRALVYGYRWLDALSHEYLHYLIMKVSANRAPIWFHEGLAKYEETRWRNGPSYLSPLYQTLLFQALAQRKLIDLERMETSFIKLDTPEEIQLAYAQAASILEFIITRMGPKGPGELMRRMAASGEKGAKDAIQALMGMTFVEFAERWKETLAGKQLKEVEGVQVRRYKVKEGKGDEDRVEMNEVKSMIARNRAHLGDRLKERGRVEAAVIEYRRALAESKESVPVMNRLSDALIRMGREGEALKVLQEAKEMAPDHPTIYTHMGRAYLKLQDFPAARHALESSIQINPFNPEVHQNLAIACEKLGDENAAFREKEIYRKLNQ